MDYEYDYNTFPLAYLVTFRCYGTWLHGDERGSMERRGHNIYGTPRIAPNPKRLKTEASLLKHAPILLTQEQRTAIEDAIREVCEYRSYDLHAVNVRANHVHSVVTAQCNPETVMDAFKSYATRRLRRNNLMESHIKPWERHGSTRYLWKPRHVSLAIEYVLYGQDNEPPAFD